MKEMIYGDTDQGLLGIEDLGDGYKLAVVNVGGTHHCAYVQFPGVESIGSHNDISVNAHVHGGFTFLGSLSKYKLEGIWLGWDYAHFGDYMFRTYRDCIPGEKMWTTAEVVNQGLDILTTIKDGKWNLGYEEKDEKSYTVTDFADRCRECGAKNHYKLGKLDALNEIKEEIKNCIVHSPYFYTTSDCCKVRDNIMQIFEKHITKLEEDEE